MRFVEHFDRIDFVQDISRPLVYFDHCGIGVFSESSPLRSRFINAFRSAGATFVLSHINLLEFTKPDDARHAVDAEQLMDDLLPNVFIAAFNPTLADAELRGEARAPVVLPSDLGLLDFFGKRCLQNGGKVSFKGFLSLAHEFQNPLKARFEASCAAIVQKHNDMKADPEFVRKAKQVKPDLFRAPTVLVMAELLRQFFSDPSAKFTPNDAADLQHAILPLLCCDFVLLDKAWSGRVIEMRRRIAAEKIDLPFARCYSPSKKSLEAFVSALEACRSNAMES